MNDHDRSGPMRVEPVVLEDAHVRLEPLDRRHAPGLLEAGAADPGTWAYLPRPPVRTPEDVLALIDEALRGRDAGSDVPFAIVLRADGRAVGSTRYLDIQRESRGLEIGWTWLAPRVRRTAVNTACKRLLLGHAFDTLGAVRVQLKCDARNARSRAAIERLGAVREGILRRNRRMWDGHIRDSVYYSILADEWPAVRARLDAFLAR